MTNDNTTKPGSLKWWFSLQYAGLVGWTALLMSPAVIAGGLISLKFSWLAGWRCAGVIILAYLAFFAVGALLGFLFGLPRGVENQGKPVDASDDSGSAKTNFRHNTNLQQISDWLTKIIIGVGLIELTKVPGKVWTWSESIGAGMKDPTAAVAEVFPTSVTLCIILYALACGFVLFYLWASLELPDKYEKAYGIEELEQKLKAGENLDAIAMRLVSSHLNAMRETDEVPANDLLKAIGDATKPARETIFDKAWLQRRDNWRQDAPTPEENARRQRKMLLTVPIFEALIAADPGDHQPHAQLAFCLSDTLGATHAQFKRAVQLLDKAIKLRESELASGKRDQYYYRFYEFVRAVCRIRVDKDFLAGKPSSEEVQELVKADLEIALQEPGIREVIAKRTGPPELAKFDEYNAEVDLLAMAKAAEDAPAP